MKNNIQENIYKIGDILLGTSIYKKYVDYKKLEYFSNEKIKDIQFKKLKKFLKYSYENVSYWHGLFLKYDFDPYNFKEVDNLNVLPILNKKDIREHYSSLVSKKYDNKDLIINHSSGSTGEPLKFIINKEVYSYNIASLLLFWSWAGYRLGEKWVRFSLWPHETIKENIYDKVARCLYIYTFEINDKILIKNINRINNFQPEIIRGYASSIYLYANYIVNNDIEVYSPKSIITTGDNLFYNYRKTIEKAFHCKVFDNYGGDGMVVSGQCEYGSYHINDTNVFVEFVKREEKDIKEKIYDIILTNINNYSMPFIRYRIGDIGKPNNDIKECRCGRGLSLMTSIEGRDTDIIYTPDGNYLIVHFFTALFEYIEGVDQFQIIQNEKDRIVIKLIRNAKFTKQDVEYIKQKIFDGGGQMLKIDFEFPEEIPVEKSGKRRFVINRT